MYGEAAYSLTNVDPREEARRKADPLSGVDVAAFVRDLFGRLAREQPALLQAAAAELLTPTQIQAGQSIFGQ